MLWDVPVWTAPFLWHVVWIQKMQKPRLSKSCLHGALSPQRKMQHWPAAVARKQNPNGCVWRASWDGSTVDRTFILIREVGVHSDPFPEASSLVFSWQAQNREEIHESMSEMRFSCSSGRALETSPLPSSLEVTDGRAWCCWDAQTQVLVRSQLVTQLARSSPSWGCPCSSVRPTHSEALWSLV